MIDAAERFIYIENQFLSAAAIARRLVRQLRRNPNLEVVIVAPRRLASWIERRTMRNGRIRFWRAVRAAAPERVRLLYPSVEQDGKRTDTMVHAKVMVIDDRLLRIGSANLSNRSMGVDTECDLAFEARSEAERSRIAAVRDRLLGEHCGVSPQAVAAEVLRTGSLLQAAERLSGDGHCLRPIRDGRLDRHPLAPLVERIADPARPPRLRQWTARALTRLVRPSAPILVVGALLLLVLGLTLGWRFTSLSQFAGPEQLGAWLASLGNGPWTAGLVVLLFVVAGALAFPVNILILAAAAAFGPWWGALYSALGAVVSALVMFAAGARFGHKPFRGLLGQRWQRAVDGVRARGVVAVVGLRLVPVAPFTLVNLAAGAAGIGLADFVLGTVIGMAPGLGLLAVMGDRVAQLLAHPNGYQLGVLALCGVLWIGLAFSAQALLSRRRAS